MEKLMCEATQLVPCQCFSVLQALGDRFMESHLVSHIKLQQGRTKPLHFYTASGSQPQAAKISTPQPLLLSIGL